MIRITLFIVPLLAASPLFAAESDPSRSELLQQRREKLKEKWKNTFREADIDDSRGLTREEGIMGGLPSALMDRFDEIDANHDDLLSPEELWDAFEKRIQEQERRQ